VVGNIDIYNVKNPQASGKSKILKNPFDFWYLLEIFDFKEISELPRKTRKQCLWGYKIFFVQLIKKTKFKNSYINKNNMIDFNAQENQRFSVPKKSEGFFRELKKEQIKLAKKVVTTDSFEKITSIAGADQFYVGNKVICAIVVCDYKSLEVIEKKNAIVEGKIPYKSGFLFYRDGPAVIEAFNKLENKPDVIIVKGNGILHPRRIGMASQVGILLDTAAIGVTKNLMLGEVKDGTIYVEKEARGYELITREYAKTSICKSRP